MENRIDKELFSLARLAATDIIRQNKIGLLAERMIHSTTKYYCQPDGALHELKHGGFVCDAILDGNVIEIQTSSFHRLRRKLEVLLPDFFVTIVYPVPKIKHIVKIDEKSGEVTHRRTSPKQTLTCEIFKEISYLRDFLGNSKLSFRLISYEIEEYRVNAPKTYRNRKGYIIPEKIPLDILSDITTNSDSELLTLLPPDLPKTFTQEQFRKHCKLNQRAVSIILSTFTNLSLIKREKVGRVYNYSVSKTITTE